MAANRLVSPETAIHVNASLGRRGASSPSHLAHFPSGCGDGNAERVAEATSAVRENEEMARRDGREKRGDFC